MHFSRDKPPSLKQGTQTVRELYRQGKITQLPKSLRKKGPSWKSVPITGRPYITYKNDSPLDACLREIEKTKSRNEIKICNFASGFSDFSLRMRKKNYHVVSVDPLFSYNYKENRRFKNVIEYHKKVVKDIDSNAKHGNYCAAASPCLPFRNDAFDLTLCSWFLFAHSNFGKEFHRKTVAELKRITTPKGKILIFPLCDVNVTNQQHASPQSPAVGEICKIVKNPDRKNSLHLHVSPHVDDVLEFCGKLGAAVNFYETIDGEFGMIIS